MCGIYGTVALAGTSRVEDTPLRAMAQAVIHRGPDDEGAFSAPGIHLGMRRLSIIDLAGGHQPISNEDGTVWVVCNGEIYNFQSLRAELERRGHRFRCASDTEVLVHLYEDEGVKLFQRLRGMFAVALWDSRRQRLVLARDRVGKKPLYLRREPHRVLFGSEIKSILADPDVPRRLNMAALPDYLGLGYVPAPLTLFEGIEKVLPGHYVVVEKGQVIQEAYWDANFSETTVATEQDWIAQVREALIDAVKVRLISDVPLGAFLSGGIDSSTIVAVMARLMGRPVKTYSIGFEGEDRFYNELPFASLVAKALGTEHHEIIVKPQVAELLPRLIWHLDEPMADSAFITTYLVSRLARESVTVILSGVGGDELFGGYRRYLGDAFAGYYHRLPGLIRRGVPAMLAALPKDRHSAFRNYVRYASAFVESAERDPVERYVSYVTVFSPSLQAALLLEPPAGPGGSAFLGQHFRRTGAADAINRLLYVDIKTSLADDLLLLTDKMSMAASIECRAPFVDQDLLALTARMPGRLKVRGFTLKYLLRKVVQPWLPREILERPKRGFGAPVGSWLRRDLRPLIEDTLSEIAVRKRGLLHWPVVRELLQRHESRDMDHTDQLLALVSLEVWCRIFLDGGDAAFLPAA